MISGLKSLDKGLRRWEAGNATLSGLSAAIVLGMTSANIIITIVIKTVTAKTALSLQILMAITVAKAVARVCVKLLPISITPKSLSVLSSSFETRFADLLFSFTRCFRRYRFIAIIPVSEPEKKADIITRKAINAKRIQRGISFNLTCSQGRKRCEKSVQ